MENESVRENKGENTGMLRRLTVITLVLMLFSGPALAEQAWIHTGKGALNMRKDASTRADIIKKIPDGEPVEVLMQEGEWSRVEYKGKKGYVKTQYLSDSAPAAGDAEGNKEENSAADAGQTAKPQKDALQQGGYAMIATGGGKLNMRRKADAKSGVVAEIPDGMRVEVETADETWTCIVFKGKRGYVKTQYVRLDSGMIGKEIYPDERYLYLLAEPDAQARSVASVHAAQRMTILEMEREWAKVACSADVYGDVEGYVRLEDIALMRGEPVPGTPSRMNAHLFASADSISLGGVIDFELMGDADAVCLAYLTRDGETLLEEKPLTERTFSYRPRTSGAYCLEVVLTREDGSVIASEARFTVGTDMQMESAAVYSQKDGWWIDKKYGRSNLDQSGCAIFALAHALHLLGLGDAAATSPEALAAAYPMYLTESGTVTSGLVNAARRDFGFATREEKIAKPDQIQQLFAEGAVFSFSVARGHIALAAGMSADGTKVRILDSAPSATFERIEDAQMYYLDESGAYRAAESLFEIPGAKYYMETNQFGGLEYYLDLAYVAKRGVRMIKPKQ